MRTSPKLLSLSIPLLVLLALPATDQEGESEEDVVSVQDGVYTREQAERGEKAYEERCYACHQPEEFTGAYIEGWSGQTAHALYDLIRTTMPQDNPSALKSREYAEILAYLFYLNGLPPGETEMESSQSALKKIRIEGPYGQP